MGTSPEPLNGISWIATDRIRQIYASINLEKKCPRSVLHKPFNMHGRDVDDDPFDVLELPKRVPTFIEMMNRHLTKE